MKGWRNGRRRWNERSRKELSSIYGRKYRRGDVIPICMCFGLDEMRPGEKWKEGRIFMVIWFWPGIAEKHVPWWGIWGPRIFSNQECWSIEQKRQQAEYSPTNGCKGHLERFHSMGSMSKDKRKPQSKSCAMVEGSRNQMHHQIINFGIWQKGS